MARVPGTRLAVLIFLAIVAGLLIAALYGYLVGAWDAAQAQGREPQLYDSSIPLDAHLLDLDKRALNAAYQDHLKLLFAVWMKDGGHLDATRITNGLRIARRAYAQASEQIAKREEELTKQRK